MSSISRMLHRSQLRHPSQPWQTRLPTTGVTGAATVLNSSRATHHLVTNISSALRTSRAPRGAPFHSHFGQVREGCERPCVAMGSHTAEMCTAHVRLGRRSHPPEPAHHTSTSKPPQLRTQVTHAWLYSPSRHPSPPRAM